MPKTRKSHCDELWENLANKCQELNMFRARIMNLSDRAWKAMECSDIKSEDLKDLLHNIRAECYKWKGSMAYKDAERKAKNI